MTQHYWKWRTANVWVIVLKTDEAESSVRLPGDVEFTICSMAKTISDTQLRGAGLVCLADWDVPCWTGNMLYITQRMPSIFITPFIPLTVTSPHSPSQRKWPSHGALFPGRKKKKWIKYKLGDLMYLCTGRVALHVLLAQKSRSWWD